MKALFAFSMAMFLLGCSVSPVKPRTALNSFPLRIGVLADSQKTTANETYQALSFRSPGADKVSPVSLRPPGLEYLSPSLLRYFLERLVKDEKADLILYLGDAANSGCDDELSEVFTALAEVRSQYGVPTYFVIGNHDYLGTGNQTLRVVKTKLCEREEDGIKNPYVDKDELIRRVANHNRASAKVDPIFNYIDVEPDYAKLIVDEQCDTSHNQFHYAAALKPKNPETHSVDILLADSSDYKNVWFRPIVKAFGHCEIIGAAGLKGSMSYEQIQDLQSLGCYQNAPCDHTGALSEGRNPQFGVDYRIIASHYDPASFNAVYRWNWSPSFVKDNLGYLLSDGENLWLGAHHHSREPITQTYPVGKSLLPGPRGAFSGFSVGSTTDYYPHAAVIEANTWFNGKITQNVGYRTIKAPDVNGICHAVFTHVEENQKAFDPVVCGNTAFDDIASMFGINKLYEQKQCWKKSTYDVVHRNIDKLLESQTAAFSPTDARLCLALLGSHAEQEVAVAK
jgi:hypothetical protein